MNYHAIEVFGGIVETWISRIIRIKYRADKIIPQIRQIRCRSIMPFTLVPEACANPSRGKANSHSKESRFLQQGKAIPTAGKSNPHSKEKRFPRVGISNL